MANEKNLKPWKPGQSGNPAGKPIGTKHLSTWIREMLEDEDFTVKLSSGKKFKGAPIQAIVKTLVVRAIEGDTRAFDLLAKYGYGTKFDVTSGGKPFAVDFSAGTSRFVRNVSN